jgi:hypothetical protein
MNDHSSSFFGETHVERVVFCVVLRGENGANTRFPQIRRGQVVQNDKSFSTRFVMLIQYHALFNLYMKKTSKIWKNREEKTSNFCQKRENENFSTKKARKRKREIIAVWSFCNNS